LFNEERKLANQFSQSINQFHSGKLRQNAYKKTTDRQRNRQTDRRTRI